MSDEDLFEIFDSPSGAPQLGENAASEESAVPPLLPPCAAEAVPVSSPLPPPLSRPTPPPEGASSPTSSHSPVVVGPGSPSQGLISPTRPEAAASPSGLQFIRAATTPSNATSSSALPLLDPLQVQREASSGIYLKRATKSFQLLPVLTTEFPFASFQTVQQQLRGGNSMEHRLCIGAVTRKSDPKPGRDSPYAVVTIWSMESLMPSPPTELALLMCGAAFQFTFSKLSLGQVIAVSALTGLPPKSGSSDGSSSLLLKVNSPQHVHLLGVAVDFGTCEATQQQSGERCRSLVNTRLSKRCAYHIKSNTSSSSKASSKGGLSTSIGASSARSHPSLLGSRPSVISPGMSPAVSQLNLKLAASPLFTVNGKTGRPSQATQPPSSFSGGVYGSVKGREQLAVSSSILSPPQQYPSTQVLGVSARGRETLMAAMKQERDRATSQALRRAKNGTNPLDEGQPPSIHAEETRAKASQPSHSLLPHSSSDGKRKREEEAASLRTKVDYEMIKRVKTDFAPIAGSVQRSAAGIRASSQKASSSALLDVVARDMVKKGLGDGSHQTASGQRVSTVQASSLISMAEKVTSGHASLVAEAASLALQTKLDKLVEQEAAQNVLSTITEESISAYYCAACHTWFLRCPVLCRTKGHRIEKRKTKKHHIMCQHCGFKTFVLGDTNAAYRILPQCSRCHGAARWTIGSAASELLQRTLDTAELDEPDYTLRGREEDDD